MPNIRVTCPACKSELEIDAAFDGQEVECGSCLEVFVAKGPNTAGTAGRSGGGKIPGAGTSGSGRSRAAADRPAKKPARRDDDDDDYEHDRRRRDDDDDDYDYPPPRRRGGGGGLGVASLVLGVLSLITLPTACCCLSWVLTIPLSIAAIVTGALGLKNPDDKVMAIIGLVCGLVSLALMALVFLAGFGNAMLNPQGFR